MHKKPKIMLLEEFVDSAIVVDNVDKELIPLVEKLKEKDIRVDSFLYGRDELRSFHRNRQLVFIDMILNENSGQDAENMSMVIDTVSKLCKDDFGLYGLVLWTKHPEKLNEMKARISRAAFPQVFATEVVGDEEEENTGCVKILPPLFVFALNKNKYIKAGYDFSSLLQDLEDELHKDSSAYFFVKWSMSLKSAKDNTVRGIYNLVNRYEEQHDKLSFLLCELAKNHTGAPMPHQNLTTDAYKAFDELLYSEMAIQQKSETTPAFPSDMSNPYGDDAETLQRISAKLNERICIDTEAISQDVVVPGNVYILKDPDSPLRININEGAYKDLFLKIVKQTLIYVAIELTPPCDFSQLKKISSRLVGGVVFEIPLGLDSKNSKKKKTIFRIDNRMLGDKSYAVYPITIGNDKVRCVCFDFRYLFTLNESELAKSKKYEIWFRAKPKLFADVLQKFSSHAARLGLSNINLAKQFE